MPSGYTTVPSKPTEPSPNEDDFYYVYYYEDGTIAHPREGTFHSDDDVKGKSKNIKKVKKYGTGAP